MVTGAKQKAFPDVGDPAPDFELPSTDNTTVRLSDLRGEVVVLLFYPAAFSPVCSAEHPVCSAELPAFAMHGARLFGISTDNTWALKAFASELNLHYPLLSDFWPHGEVSKRYGMFRPEGTSSRATVIIDAEGIIRYRKVIPILEQRDVKELLEAVKDIAG